MFHAVWIEQDLRFSLLPQVFWIEVHLKFISSSPVVSDQIRHITRIFGYGIVFYPLVVCSAGDRFD